MPTAQLRWKIIFCPKYKIIAHPKSNDWSIRETAWLSEYASATSRLLNDNIQSSLNASMRPRNSFQFFLLSGDWS